jgi:hypothetical protein
MRAILVLVLMSSLTLGLVGCGSGSRPAPTEDTAAEPSPEIMNIPKPSEVPEN